MSNEDKIEMIQSISDKYNCEASEESKLLAIRLILDYKPEELRWIMEIWWEEAPKWDDLELWELPENIKFIGEDKDGNGIYKVS